MLNPTDLNDIAIILEHIAKPSPNHDISSNILTLTELWESNKISKQRIVYLKEQIIDLKNTIENQYEKTSEPTQLNISDICEHGLKIISHD